LSPVRHILVLLLIETKGIAQKKLVSQETILGKEKEPNAQPKPAGAGRLALCSLEEG